MPHLMNNMSHILKFLCFLLFLSCSDNKIPDCNYITDYYPKIYEAQLNYNQKDYREAFELYSEAFEICEPKNTVGIYEMNKYAEISAILEKEELALNFIEKNLAQGMLLRSYTNNPVFSNVLKTDRGKNIIANYDSTRAKYLNSLNLKLRSEIQEMMKADQTHIQDQEKRNIIFQRNTKRLIEIFENVGYPGNDIIGPYNVDFSNSDISILLLHTSDSIRINYFIPKLKEYVKNGDCDPKTLGMVIDNLHLFNNELQIIGTYEKREENMISDKELVNQNRLEIGLPTLEVDEKL
jgi:hypothetical protein